MGSGESCSWRDPQCFLLKSRDLRNEQMVSSTWEKISSWPKRDSEGTDVLSEDRITVTA